jgi:hypothetical protein
VALNIVVAWVLTIPGAALISALIFTIIKFFNKLASGFFGATIIIRSLS